MRILDTTKMLLRKLDAFCCSKWFYLLVFFIAFTFVLFNSETTSIKFNYEGCDSSVFKMMGYVITEGGVPYVDYFDHKGPILYFINAFGEIISPQWGLFLIQIIFCFFTLLLWFKISRLFIRPTYSFIVLLFSIVIYSGLYEYGNLTEEYSLLPSSIAIYYALSYLIKNKNSKRPYIYGFICGLCFGFMFYIRPNDAVIQCGGVMSGIFFYLIYVQKTFKTAFLNALVFLCGFILISSPIVIYFLYNHAINEFFFGLIGFNLNYNGGIIKNVLEYRFTIPLVSLCSIPIILSYSANKRIVLWLLFPITLLCVLFFGRNGFPHYYMSLMPAIFVLMITLLFVQKNSYIICITVILIIMIPNRWGGKKESFHYSELGYSVLKGEIKELINGSLYQKTNKSLFESEKLFRQIPCAEKDSIWNYNDTFSSLFYHNKIIAQNAVPPVIAYQYRNFPADSLFLLDIKYNKPLWVFMIDESRYGWELQYILPNDSIYLVDNYEVFAKSDSTICSYYLLKRKN